MTFRIACVKSASASPNICPYEISTACSRRRKEADSSRGGHSPPPYVGGHVRHERFGLSSCGFLKYPYTPWRGRWVLCSRFCHFGGWRDSVRSAGESACGWKISLGLVGLTT